MVKFIILLLLPALTLAKTNINDFRFWSSPQKSRLVLDVSKPVWYQFRQSRTQTEIYINDVNLPKSSFKKLKKYRDNQIKDIRLSRKKSDLILTINHPKTPRVEHFSLKPNSKYPNHRLVIDLYKQSSSKPQIKPKPKQKVIVIDPGHGGEDPGAIGYRGTYEKHITLSIAKQLAQKINQIPGYYAVLTRTADYYVPLTKRVRLAQEQQANLFISIHADAVHDKTARGSSVYTLSSKGANTKFAKQLEQSENASDRFGGVQSFNNDQYLTQILWDYARNDSKTQSHKLAQAIINQLKQIGIVHNERVQSANFVVLKTPAVPSVLIEVAFISNYYDERRLRSKQGQQRIVNAILSGIKQY